MLASAIMLPVVSIALAIRTFWSKTEPVDPLLAAQERLAMATVMVEGSDIGIPFFL